MPWTDDFNDNSRDVTKWDVYQVNTGVVSEVNQRLQINIPNVDSSFAGYVSVVAWNLQNHFVQVDVVELDSIGEMDIYICLTKVTSSRVYLQANWYRICHDNAFDVCKVTKRVAGGSEQTLYSGAWVAPTGTLKIVITGTTIEFYENNILRYSETYALASYMVYIYLEGGGGYLGNYTGIDAFDNYVSDLPVVVETIVAKSFPMLYLAKPINAQELISKVEGATITKVSQDFPLVMLKTGKAQELRSKWTE